MKLRPRAHQEADLATLRGGRIRGSGDPLKYAQLWFECSWLFPRIIRAKPGLFFPLEHSPEFVLRAALAYQPTRMIRVLQNLTSHRDWLDDGNVRAIGWRTYHGLKRLLFTENELGWEPSHVRIIKVFRSLHVANTTHDGTRKVFATKDTHVLGLRFLRTNKVDVA